MTPDRTALSYGVLAGIVVASAAIAFGPLFSPPGFDWIVHSTSEQAGQGMPGGWIMRIGFVSYGLGVAVAATLRWRDAPAVRTALLAFGLGLIATAIWSNAPILPGLPADMAQDNLHSIASGLVGTAFAIACAARLIGRRQGRPDWLALSGVLIAVAIPLGMNAFPDLRGLLQRAMFAFSFVFVLREFGFTIARRP